MFSVMVKPPSVLDTVQSSVIHGNAPVRLTTSQISPVVRLRNRSPTATSLSVTVSGSFSGAAVSSAKASGSYCRRAAFAFSRESGVWYAGSKSSIADLAS